MKPKQTKQSKQIPQNVSVTRRAKRWFACGCSHGHLINTAIADDCIKAKKHWNPHTTLHLGDFLDETAFMVKALAGGSDSHDIADDVVRGLHFLERLEPDTVFLGNHDERAYMLLDHHKQEVKFAAQSVVDDIERLVTGELKAELVPYSGVTGGGTWSKKSFRALGNSMAFCHGFTYGLGAGEKHCLFTGMSTVFVHTHCIEVRPVRALGDAYGYNIGFIGDVEKMHYASRREKTMTWANGWASGEYGDDWCNAEIHICPTKQEAIPQIN